MREDLHADTIQVSEAMHTEELLSFAFDLSSVPSLPSPSIRHLPSQCTTRFLWPVSLTSRAVSVSISHRLSCLRLMTHNHLRIPHTQGSLPTLLIFPTVTELGLISVHTLSSPGPRPYGSHCSSEMNSLQLQGEGVTSLQEEGKNNANS